MIRLTVTEAVWSPFGVPGKAAAAAPDATSDSLHTLVYTGVFANLGTKDASQATISLSAPAGTLFLGPGRDWETIGEQTYEHVTGPIAVGQVITLQWQAQTPLMNLGDAYTVVVTITDTVGEEPDANLSNNTLAASFFVVPSPTATATATVTATATSTPTRQPSATPVPPATPAPGATATPTVTWTATPTPTPISVELDPLNPVVVTSGDTGVNVIVPAGAVTATVRLDYVPLPSPTPTPGQLGLVAFVLRVSDSTPVAGVPTSTTFYFQNPIYLTAQVQDPTHGRLIVSSLTFCRRDSSGDIEVLATYVDPVTLVASATTDRTGEYFLRAELEPIRWRLPLVLGGP